MKEPFITRKRCRVLGTRSHDDTGRSGVILDSIQQVRPMIVRSIVCSRPSKLEPSEPPHTRTFRSASGAVSKGAHDNLGL
jgi:hypothetical protein